MQMTGEQHVAAPRSKVWEALNDPEILRQCIPGCQSLDRDGDNRFVAVAEVKIGPIGARFKGDVALSDLVPPEGYTITGSGSGGIAGNAKGGARVRLTEAGEGTLVSYTVDADVGGRMAQLGGPIIDATAKNLAGKFFAKFGEIVADGETTGVSEHASEAGQKPASPSAPVALPNPQPLAHVASVGTAPLWGWVAALVAALLAGFALGASGRQIELAISIILLVVTATAAYEAGRRGAGR